MAICRKRICISITSIVLLGSYPFIVVARMHGNFILAIRMEMIPKIANKTVGPQNILEHLSPKLALPGHIVPEL